MISLSSSPFFFITHDSQFVILVVNQEERVKEEGKLRQVNLLERGITLTKTLV